MLFHSVQTIIRKSTYLILTLSFSQTKIRSVHINPRVRLDFTHWYRDHRCHQRFHLRMPTDWRSYEESDASTTVSYCCRKFIANLNHIHAQGTHDDLVVGWLSV